MNKQISFQKVENFYPMSFLGLNHKHIKTIKEIELNQDRSIHIIKDLSTGNNYYQITLLKKFGSEHESNEFATSINKISKHSSHPSLLRIIDFNLGNNDTLFPSIYTEYIPNGILSDFLNQAPPYDFTGTKKFIILLGISIGMRYYYFNYINHGKLEPNKIFLDEHFYPHILNYEITPNVSDEKNYLRRIKCQSDDVFSFSIIAYEIITGKKPPSPKERPDLTIIENGYVRKFLQKCLSYDSFRKPFFYKLHKKLLKKRDEFAAVLGEIDEQEVQRYMTNNDEFLSTFSEEVKLRADKGELTAISTYGFMLFNGYGIKEDKYEALKYYELSAQKGSTNVMYYLGLMHENGDGIPQNHKEAVRYYKMAADLGHPDAINNYGLMLETGQGIDQNQPEAARCYKRAAELGNIVSMGNYGYMLSNGIGVDIDKKESAKYYKMAADNGNTRGMLCYSVMLSSGEGIEKDVKEAARYMEMAAYQGNPEALFGYAAMLDEGNGVEVDKNKAIRYFKMAADKGRPYAIYEYGIRLFLGDGIEKNYEEAVKYVLLASEKGYAAATFAYGAMLEHGEGIKMNKFEAARFYKKAAYQGYDRACEAYRHISRYIHFSI